MTPTHLVLLIEIKNPKLFVEDDFQNVSWCADLQFVTDAYFQSWDVLASLTFEGHVQISAGTRVGQRWSRLRAMRIYDVYYTNKQPEENPGKEILNMWQQIVDKKPPRASWRLSQTTNFHFELAKQNLVNVAKL